jgi:hypothetical protein
MSDGKRKPPAGAGIGFGTAIGVALGVSIGTATDNLGLGSAWVWR